MAGGRLEGASAQDAQSPRQLTRRDFTRLGAVAGGVIWTAPRITSIRFAQKVVGSHVPTTTSTTEGTVPTSSTTTTNTTTSTTTSTTGPSTTTSTTVGPTTTTSLGSTGSTESTTSVPRETTTTVCKPGNGNGDKNHCHTGPPGQVKNTGSTIAGASGASGATGGTGGGGGGGGGSGGGVLGALSFTGADSVDLAILGATAVVTGRALYAFGRHRREDEEELLEGDEAGALGVD
jgi:hypothetical protein